MNISVPRLIFGDGRLCELPSIAKDIGRRILILTGSGCFQDTSHWQDLTEALTRSSVSWTSVRVGSEPSPDMVDDVVREHHSSGIEAVLAIGGGSVIDAAKAVAGLLPFGNSVMDHLEVVGRGISYPGPALPLVAVPTTAGTGSEATKNAVLTVRGPKGFKRSFRHESLMPHVALIDPILTHTCPPELTAASGMDAVTQLIESFVSTGADVTTDALAAGGLRAAREGLVAAYRNHPAGRTAMSYAAFCSGVCLAHSGLGIIHGLASPLGSYHSIPHGVACAATLIAGIRINIQALRERSPESPSLSKYAEAGAILSGEPGAAGRQALDALMRTLSRWKDEMQIGGLGAYGLREADLPAIATQSRAKTNPVELSEAEMITILRESL